MLQHQRGLRFIRRSHVADSERYECLLLSGRLWLDRIVKWRNRGTEECRKTDDYRQLC